MALEVQVTPDKMLLIQLLQMYYIVATIGIAVGGWIAFLAPNLSDELTNLVYFGKYRSKQRSRLQRLLEVPKSWFIHFYVVASIFSITAALAIFGCFKEYDVWNDDWLSDRLRIAIVLFSLHSLRRLYESLFISVFSDSKMNVLHYVLGMSFYVCVPTTILLSGSYTEHFWRLAQLDPFDVSKYDALTLCVFAGSFIWLWAVVHQHKSFRILAKLREGRSNTTHSIPFGDLFRFVSSPHYLCECVMYSGLWLVVGLHCQIWIWLLLFVFNNQILCALQAHRWYHNTFGNKYPRNRTAFLPFIF